MEDYGLVGILASIITLIIIVIFIYFVTTRYDNLIEHAKDYNKSILSILEGE